MGFTVKKANREGPAPLLALTLGEARTLWPHFKHGSVYSTNIPRRAIESGGVCLRELLSDSPRRFSFNLTRTSFTGLGPFAPFETL